MCFNLLQNFNWRHLKIQMRVHCTWMNGSSKSINSCPHTALWIEWAQHWWVSLSLQHLSDSSVRGTKQYSTSFSSSTKDRMQEMTSMWLMFTWLICQSHLPSHLPAETQECQWRFANNRKGETSQYCLTQWAEIIDIHACLTQWAEIIDIHACETLSSGIWEASHWPKMVSGRIMAPDPPSCVLMYMITPSLMAMALCAKFETWSVYINSCCHDSVNYETKQRGRSELRRGGAS